MKIRLLMLTVLVVASPALATEEGGEGNIFAGDLGNVVWTLVIFGLVLWVLGRYAWGPLLEGLQKREQFIRDSLEAAKRDRDEAEIRLKEYTEKLTAARAEATGIVDEGRRDAEVVKRRIEEEARQAADEMVARAKREIDLAKQTAIVELYATSASLATDIASRIVRRELRVEDHERLLRESIDALRKIDAN
ncbi:MAG: F0F1 ATP synthase subunit B [Thermoanaerobaculia bacterium]